MKYLNYVNLGLAVIGVLFCLYAFQITFLGERPVYSLEPNMAQLTEFPPAEASPTTRSAPEDRSQPPVRTRPPSPTGASASPQMTPDPVDEEAEASPAGHPLPSGGVVPGQAVRPATVDGRESTDRPATDAGQRAGSASDVERPAGGRRGSPSLRPSSGRPNVAPPQDRSGSKRDPQASPTPPRPRGSNQ